VTQVLRAWLPVVVVASMLPMRAIGQDTPPRQGAAASAGSVEEVGPTTIYLKDEKGNLVPVPGFSYERYRELILLEGRMGAEPPPFTIERLRISGTVEGDVAKLDTEATIHVRKAGWVAVPLRLSGAHLQGPIAAEKEDDPIHRYDAKEGHVVWLNGAANRRHSLRLPLTARLGGLAGEEKLTLLFPRVSEARLMLDIAGSIGEATLESGEGLVETSTENGRSQINVTGASGDVTLAWQSKQSTSNGADWDVTTEILARLETRDSIAYEANFHVTCSGESIRRLFIRLPPGTELRTKAGRGFTIAQAALEEIAQAGIEIEARKGAAIVRVDLERPAQTVDFSLEAELKPESQSKQAPLEVGGFEVLGARRQSGFVSVLLPAGWSLKAMPNAAVFRTDDLPTLPGQTRANARYRFVRQPFSLKIDAAPQPPRTVVEPAFFAVVEAQRVTLAATLDYQVRGARPDFLEIDAGDWILGAAGPDNLVEVEPSPDVGKPIRLNLQPGLGTEFTLQLQFHRDVPEDSVELAFGLPRARASQTLPASLAITAADNIALSPQNEDIAGLIQEERVPDVPLPSARSRPYAYREVPAGTEPPRFVAGFQVRKRRVTAMVDGRIQLGDGRAQIEQQVVLDIAYEPLQTITLEAPAAASLSSLQVFSDEQVLDLREDAVSDAPRGASALRRWRVELPRPSSGKVELAVSYALTLPPGETIQLPLVAPSEEGGVIVARQKLSVELRSDHRYVLAENHADDPGLSATQTAETLEYVWPRRVASVFLDRAARATVGPALQVERQWLQTWLSPGGRRDRFVARIVGVQDQFSVTLPAGVLAADVRVLVDGEPPGALSIEDNLLSLSLAAMTNKPHTLELWYLLPGPARSMLPQRLNLELPRLMGASTPLQSWVQVVTPSNDQVLYSPSAVIPQQSWRKRGWLWQRAGSRTMSELETWVGATSRLQEEELDAGDALFMTLGPLQSLEVVIWGRRWMWLFVSGGILAAGALVYYLSRGRSVLLLGALAAAGFVAAMLSPELTLNVSQFVGVGLLLLLAVVWSLRVTGKTGETLASATSSTSITRRPDSRVVRRGSSATGSAAFVTSGVEETQP